MYRPAILLLASLLPAASPDPVRARRAMVVSREDHATQAGLRVLQQGGNAIDAAVAVGFALAVTHPAAGNIGGGGFLLVRFADGRAVFLDFRERAPERASARMFLDADGKLHADANAGYHAAGVPGTVRGLEHAHKKWGRKPWSELLQPAVDLAAKGFPVSWDLSRSLQSKLLARFPESRRIFQRDGRHYEMGETLQQPDLARTLTRIARHGSADFYEGETARLLAADMAGSGGLITLDDLRRYQPVEREPLRGSYRGYDILTAPPPSSGGAGILQMLAMLEGSGYERAGHGSAASIHYLTEVMRRYFADRARYFGDPDFSKIPASELTSRDYAHRRRASIVSDRATPSADIAPGPVPGFESSQTTHYSIVDPDGNAVAVTYTLNAGYGCGATAQSLGFLLNNEMGDFSPGPGVPNSAGLLTSEANAIQPRKRPLSSMTPTMVTRDGKLALVAGSPGGPTIINTVLLVLLSVLDFGMNVQRAVDSPRFHHQWMPDDLRLEEGGFSPDTVDLLRARGHTIRFVRSQGDAAAIHLQDGWLLGAADPRGDGTARGF